MALKAVKERIQLKNDTEANWNKAVNFVPLVGELIIYRTDDAHPFSRLKIGDGETTVVNLPFLDTNNDLTIEVDDTKHWQEKIDYIPEKDTILIYTDKAVIEQDGKQIAVPGIKIADGAAFGIDQPFVGDDIAYNLIQHINDTSVHITEEERYFWNNKLNYDETINDELLVFTRN